MPEATEQKKKPGRRPGRPRKKEKEVKDSRGVSAQIERILLSKKSPVDIVELAMEFIESVGGTKGYIKLMMDDYNASRVGSAERARFLEFGAKLIQIAASSQQGTDFDTMTEEDLEMEARRLIAKTGIKSDVIDHVCI